MSRYGSRTYEPTEQCTRIPTEDPRPMDVNEQLRLQSVRITVFSRRKYAGQIGGSSGDPQSIDAIVSAQMQCQGVSSSVSD